MADVNVQLVRSVAIADEFCEPVDPFPVEGFEPITGRAWSYVGGGRADADLALDRADQALGSWAAASATTRARCLNEIADGLDARTDPLAMAVCEETGKRLTEATAEVAFSSAFLRYYADLLTGATSPLARAATPRHAIRWEPAGVAVLVTPWNFPISIPARKIGPALAAGCPVLFKPSELTPRSTGLFWEAVIEAVPPGVANMVFGNGPSIVERWVDDDRVRVLSFTGSTRVGRVLARRAAPRFLRSILELGGAAPFIVLEDADPLAVVDGLMVAKHRNNGQSCISANHAWVPQGLYDSIVSELVRRTGKMRIGDPRVADTDLGPLALSSDPSRLADLTDRLVALGSRVLESDAVAPDVGNFVAPVIVETPASAADGIGEVFGPLLPISAYGSLDEALARVRTIRAGLGGYIYGPDVQQAEEVASRLDVGIVGVNTPTPNTPSALFAGRGDSGLGIEGGVEGLHAFAVAKTVARG